ncbi:hypothetical protein [Polaribacter aestuariivivens]|nr:hypothetical protein [Polaribacter aestuariivivens]
MEVGSWEFEGGRWKLEAGSWEFEVGRWEFGAVSKKLNEKINVISK